ncbi:NAD(P)/FAD-dependent oxidoreductase [Streptomyces nondiastaticus]|uniref:NAD(P)/FAD-dependent oxidoreductase n=1 Tax=Streptomyces nondiastaticus TaxID=3154512 RepID=A0ABW6U3V4_9ACTN
MSATSARAVVIGGSMAGLLAARVLTETHEQVVIIDRDVLPVTATHRCAVPQARHSHWLLASGLSTLESFFPGLSAELTAAGATPADPHHDGSWVFDGYQAKRARSDLAWLMMSRTLVESRVRGRVTALPGVRLLPGHEVLGLLGAAGKSAVGGVRVVRRGRSRPVLDVRADLVVDASGRGSRVPLWLRELGYPPPRENRVRLTIAYATRHYRRDRHHPPGTLTTGAYATPVRTRGAALSVQENDRWVLTLVGILGDEPPLDADGFTAFGVSLGDPAIRQIVTGAEPLDVPLRARFPECSRRRYERLRRLPEGLVVIGDAMCSSNPALAHGMSVAAMQAQVLRDSLLKGPDRLSRRYFRKAARVLTVPWIATLMSDVRCHEAGRRRPPVLWLTDLGRTVLSRAMERDTVVTEACLRVAHLVTGPWLLFSPSVVLRVLLAQVPSRRPRSRSGHATGASELGGVPLPRRSRSPAAKEAP